MARRRTLLPATQARLAAGLIIEQAAKRARVSEGYLRRIERDGASYVLARRLATIYACSMNCFLPPKRKEDS
jgi:transcriptional regulator with XRE-family HTH domain